MLYFFDGITTVNVVRISTINPLFYNMAIHIYPSMKYQDSAGHEVPGLSIAADFDI